MNKNLEYWLMIWIILAILILFFLILLAFNLLVKKRGDAFLQLKSEEPTALGYNFLSPRVLTLAFPFEMHNSGKQQALVIDLWGRLSPEIKLPQGIEAFSRLLNPAVRRSDGYWEAFLVKSGKTETFTGQLMLISPQADFSPDFLTQLKELKFDISAKYYCRTPMIYRHFQLKFDLSKAVKNEDAELYWGYIASPPSARAPRPGVFPVKTHLLAPGEDIVEIINRYVKPDSQPGDLVAIAESPLAIMQKRLVYAEEMRLSWLAKKLNWIFGMDSSMSSVYSLEMGLREIGAPRFILAALAGILGKALGREGDFYRLAGRQVAVIDDCTGTIPPYDKYVVLAPGEPQKVVEEIKAKTGLEAAIVDANDLGKVDILGSSSPKLNPVVQQALGNNPQGNANQQTPLILIRPSQVV